MAVTDCSPLSPYHVVQARERTLPEHLRERLAGWLASDPGVRHGLTRIGWTIAGLATRLALIAREAVSEHCRARGDDVDSLDPRIIGALRDAAGEAHRCPTCEGTRETIDHASRQRRPCMACGAILGDHVAGCLMADPDAAAALLDPGRPPVESPTTCARCNGAGWYPIGDYQINPDGSITAEAQPCACGAPIIPHGVPVAEHPDPLLDPGPAPVDLPATIGSHPCPHCNGDGTYERTDAAGVVLRTMECGPCGGTGVWTPPAERQDPRLRTTRRMRAATSGPVTADEVKRDPHAAKLGG